MTRRHFEHDSKNDTFSDPIETPMRKGVPALKDMSQEEQRLHRNAEILRMMPDNIADALAKARYKPIWCSDVRWRMELARRKRAKFGY